jgi:hypothetical protein
MYTDLDGRIAKRFLNNTKDKYFEIFWYPWDAMWEFVAIHYTRNLNITEIYYNEQEAIKNWWVLQSANLSIYHTFWEWNESNKKYLSPDGHNELVFSKEWRLVVDETNEGTFNYGTNMVSHFMKDVFPYYIMGNGINDTTNFYQRVSRYFDNK